MIIIVPEGGFDAGGLGRPPEAPGLLCIVDLLAPFVFAPFLHRAMGRADVALPGAATQNGVAELAIALVHFQDHVAVAANEAAERDGAGAATGEAITVSDVAVVRELAGAVAVGAGAGFEGGSHGFEARSGGRPPLE